MTEQDLHALRFKLLNLELIYAVARYDKLFLLLLDCLSFANDDDAQTVEHINHTWTNCISGIIQREQGRGCILWWSTCSGSRTCSTSSSASARCRMRFRRDVKITIFESQRRAELREGRMIWNRLCCV